MATYQATRTVYVHQKNGDLGAGPRRSRFTKGQTMECDPDAHATKALVEDGSLVEVGAQPKPAPTRRRRAKPEDDED
jgi:hypothetical protein